MPPKLPHMDFIFRLDCNMAAEDANQDVGAPFHGTQSRLILPIVGGTVKGPQISGVIQPLSGADWGMKTTGTDFMRLDARYTLMMDDGHFVFVRSKGIFAPQAPDFEAAGPPVNISQSECDWFTRFQFEAGPGPYNWMNSTFAIGVLTMEEKRIVIHAYRLTNFPDLAPRDLVASSA